MTANTKKAAMMAADKARKQGFKATFTKNKDGRYPVSVTKK